MTDTIVGDANAIDPKDLYVVEIAKAAAVYNIDSSKLSDELYREAVRLGLKAMMERGLAKHTKNNTSSAEDLAAKTKALSDANYSALLDGSYALTAKKGAKKSTMSTEVRTEAMRIAKNIVKDKIKASKQKISHFKPSDITAAAKQVLEAMPQIVDQAKANIAARGTVDGVATLDISKLIHADEKQVAKVEKERAERKADRQLSAKQAGKVKPRSKPAPTAIA